MSNALKKLPKLSPGNPIDQICQVATQLTGVQLGPRHHSMVTSRLQRRIAEIGLQDFAEYIAYLEENFEEESQKLIALITTHHTFFFREFAHFEYLAEKGLEPLIAVARARGDKKIRIWCAACSRGQEVYSLAMFLKHHIKEQAPDVSLEIMGSDIDGESVQFAKNGVYRRSELKEAPLTYVTGNWQKGTGEIADYVRAADAMRSFCKFEVRNLFALKPDPKEKYDIIFCRNVFIYFNGEQISAVTKNLMERIHPHGLFFIGISESLNGLALPVDPIGPSIYRPRGASIKVSKAPETFATKTASAPAAAAPKPTSPQSLPNPLKVFCIDDSPSIHQLLGRMLTKDQGFTIVGTAKNGLEAQEKLPASGADLVTLDIHMPEMDGLQYLQKNFSSKHPPVIMVSSVSRESADLAMRALELGAFDYVEKPALSAMFERGEELRMKLKTAFRSKNHAQKDRLKLDTSFSARKTIPNPQSKLRAAVFGPGDRKTVAEFVRQTSGATTPPLLLLVEGVEGAIQALAENIQRQSGATVLTEGPLKPGCVYLFDLNKGIDLVRSATGAQSLSVFGDVTRHSAGKITAAFKPGTQILLEELSPGSGAEALMAASTDVVPATSFAYMTDEFLCR